MSNRNHIESEWFSDRGFVEIKSEREKKKTYVKQYKGFYLLVEEHDATQPDAVDKMCFYNLIAVKNLEDKYRTVIRFLEFACLFKPFYDDYTKT